MSTGLFIAIPLSAVLHHCCRFHGTNHESPVADGFVVLFLCAATLAIASRDASANAAVEESMYRGILMNGLDAALGGGILPSCR